MDLPDGCQQGGLCSHCRGVIYPVKKSVGIEQKKINKESTGNTTSIQSAVLASPYIVIHTGCENSVPSTGGEIRTGYA